jgi:hypothetical protein
VGPRAGLDGCEKSRPPTGIRSPNRPDRSELLYRQSYPGPRYVREPLKMRHSASRPFCHDTKISEEIRPDCTRAVPAADTRTCLALCGCDIEGLTAWAEGVMVCGLWGAGNRTLEETAH